MMPESDHGSESKTFLGFWLYLLSDVLLFAVIFATYAVLRTGTAGDLKPGELIAVPRALGETLLLLGSSFLGGLYLGENKLRALTCLAAMGLLAAVFCVAVFGDLALLLQQGHSYEKSAFLSVYFFLVGTLLFHMLAGLLWIALLFFQICKRGMIASTGRRLVCLQMFWHFLTIVWIGIYYWVYLMGAA